MGGPGGGPYTPFSKAFDICDLFEDCLRHTRRHLHGDPERPLDHETLDRWEAELAGEKVKLRKAIEAARRDK